MYILFIVLVRLIVANGFGYNFGEPACLWQALAVNHLSQF
jgi:hypothetical protein